MTHGLHGDQEYYSTYKQFSFGITQLLLPALKINDDTVIYVLNIMGGNPHQVKHFALDLTYGVKKVYDLNMLDTVITAEGKSIPLAYEVASQLNLPYVVLRKSVKDYMTGLIVGAEVRTPTTTNTQMLYLDNKDTVYLSGKKLLFIDDVISTGSTLKACENIVSELGGKIVACAAMATEGGYKPDLPYFALCDLPVIKLNGKG